MSAVAADPRKYVMPRPLSGLIRWTPHPSSGTWYPAYATSHGIRWISCTVFPPDDRLGNVVDTARHVSDPEFLTIADQSGGVWDDDPGLRRIFDRLDKLEAGAAKSR